MAIRICQLQRPPGPNEPRLIAQLHDAWRDDTSAKGLGLGGDRLQIAYPQAQLPVGPILEALVGRQGPTASGFAVVEALHTGALLAAMAGDVHPGAPQTIEPILFRP